MQILKTAIQIASEIGCTAQTVRRTANRLGIARSPHVYTVAEARQIGRAINSEPGNPAMKSAHGQRKLLEKRGKTRGK